MRIAKNSFRAGLNLLFLCFVTISFVALACRCAQQTLDTYFEQADVVAEVEVVKVEPLASANAIEISLRSLHLYKGHLDRSLLTPKDGAACGLTFTKGERWWLFAARPLAEGFLHANICAGSRKIDQTFLNVSNKEVSSHLSSLSQTADVKPQPTVPVTCGQETRKFHAPASDEVRSRFLVERRPREGSVSSGIKSPNDAYHFTVLPLPPAQRPPFTGRMLIDTERDYQLEIQVFGIQNRTASGLLPRWINEKVIQIHVFWSPTEVAEALFDVESEKFIYLQSVYEGKRQFADRHGSQHSGEKCE